MTDLEPASALAERVLKENAEASVDFDGEAHLEVFVEPAARLIEADRAAVREPLERRIAELTDERDQARAGLGRWEEFAAKHDVSPSSDDRMREGLAKRIASLEAQLVSAREEALRGAIRFIRGESSASESIGKHEWACFGSWLANKLAEELPPPAAQKEPHGR